MFTQENRPLQISTPLGANRMIVTALRGREAISELFHFEVEVMWQESAPLKFTDLLGKGVTIQILDSDPHRYINGIVSAIEQGARDRERDLTKYTLHVVPNTWALTRNAQCRIFQEKSVPDIVKEVITDMGLSNTLKLNLMGSYAPRDYCVQYRESDFAFISRLMESEGIFYFYQHDASQHTMVVADQNSVFQDLPSGSTIEFEEAIGGLREKSRIFEWTKSQEICAGKYTQTDYNFETPATSLMTDSQFQQNVAFNQSLEIYDYPGHYMKTNDGEPYTKKYLAGENTFGVEARGKSWFCGLYPGYKFTLKNHFADDGKYALTSVEHNATQPLEVNIHAQNPFDYENTFTAIGSDISYRPPRVTASPHVKGVQTAMVVGPAGEEIYTDKYGRIKVQFHWDREGKKDEKSSCWIRVATHWAGKNWGAIHIPRMGQEVVVDFVDGDVDRPLIVGSVYNANTMPPYTLPGEKTKSGIQTRSSKGGTAANFNEIRFEDKKGSEELHIHAEKDQTIEVEHDESHWVGHDRSKAIDHDETTQVKHDRTETVDNDETITIHHDRTETVDNNESITIGKDRTRNVGNNESVTIGKDQSLSVGKNLTATIGLNEDRTAGKEIVLKVGNSSITIDQTGVTIQGLKISIQGKIQVDVKSVMTSINGDAMTTVKGGIVMIN